MKVLPGKGRNILITSALPYVNNVPHLGNIIGCVLSADVFARFCRLKGYTTLFICGTDEYGTATETKALEEKLSCKELCDKYFALHKKTYEWFDIAFDHFGRTTTQQQTEIAQDIYKDLEKAGLVFEDSVTQLYCEQHSAFLADRFVEGTCPLCGYEDARGDQCDKCGKLLNAVELIKPHCKVDGATPVIKSSKHLFLDLTKQQPILADWVEKTSKNWSSNSQAITMSWLKEGLKPRCITRDLKWGTPVPRDGFENKVFYVWFDAPIGYLSITANYTDEWEKWWKNPDVELYQFMGKDNVPFHTVIFPSTLLGTGKDWTLLKHLSTTEYLQYESGKFSKSRGVGVFGNNVMDSGIPVAVWRYYLLLNRPETSDSQFTWSSFVMANNTELLANLGNYCNRVIKFITSKYEATIPKATLTPTDEAFISNVNQQVAQYVKLMEAVQIRAALKIAMHISAMGNQYLQENKLDNTLFAESRERCDTVVSVAANLIYLLSSLIHPFMPSTCESMIRQLQGPKYCPFDFSILLPGGHKIGKPEYLFTRIEESRVETLRSMYSGNAPPPPKVDKKKKKKPQGISTVPEGVPKTAEMDALEQRIAEQGQKVRDLKASKADAKEAVDQLLELKCQLEQLVLQK